LTLKPPELTRKLIRISPDVGYPKDADGRNRYLWGAYVWGGHADGNLCSRSGAVHRTQYHRSQSGGTKAGGAKRNAFRQRRGHGATPATKAEEEFRSPSAQPNTEWRIRTVTQITPARRIECLRNTRGRTGRSPVRFATRTLPRPRTRAAGRTGGRPDATA